MIELRPIRRIQNEYFALLNQYIDLIKGKQFEYKDYLHMIDDVSIFWKKNIEKMEYFLENIEFEDECVYLAGAMWIDLDNLGHYEMAISGKQLIYNDPIMKLSTFFNPKLDEVRLDETIKYFNKVFIDCYNVLELYRDKIFVIPVSFIFNIDNQVREDVLQSGSKSYILNLFTHDQMSFEELSEKYKTFESIEESLSNVILDRIIFYDISDNKRPLRVRIESNLSRMFNYKLLRTRMSEFQLFSMAMNNFILQSIDILLISSSYHLIPFIRSDVVFNYYLLITGGVNEESPIKEISEVIHISYMFRKIVDFGRFNDVGFECFWETLINNNVRQRLIDELKSINRNIMDIKPEIVASCIYNLLDKYYD